MVVPKVLLSLFKTTFLCLHVILPSNIFTLWQNLDSVLWIMAVIMIWLILSLARVNSISNPLTLAQSHSIVSNRQCCLSQCSSHATPTRLKHPHAHKAKPRRERSKSIDRPSVLECMGEKGKSNRAKAGAVICLHVILSSPLPTAIFMLWHILKKNEHVEGFVDKNVNGEEVGGRGREGCLAQCGGHKVRE